MILDMVPKGPPPQLLRCRRVCGRAQGLLADDGVAIVHDLLMRPAEAAIRLKRRTFDVGNADFCTAFSRCYGERVGEGNKTASSSKKAI